MKGKRATTIRAVYGKSGGRYLDLVRQFPLRPLRTDGDLDAAVAVINALVDRSRLSAAEQDYLDVLSDLVEAYEDETIPMRPVGDAELLRFLVEQKSVTQAEAAAGAGIAESTISALLGGKRKLNRTQIGPSWGHPGGPSWAIQSCFGREHLGLRRRERSRWL